MSKVILTDGVKSTNLLWSSDPTVWSGVQVTAQNESDLLYYSRVAAVFRAFNLKANTVGNMPFVLVKQTAKDEAGKPKSTGIKAIDDTADGNEVDNSATWENHVGFLPNPSEIFRLNTLSYMNTNTIYVLRGMNATQDVTRPKRTKSLVPAVPYNFTPRLNGQGTNVDYIERRVGTMLERYAFPDDKRLIRMWRMDHTTELLPSPNTEARAIMNSAGVMMNTDYWIKHFFERGGVVPMVIAMKGAVSNDKKEEEAENWTKWYLGLRDRFKRIFRVINAESLDVKPVGSGIGELKDNVTYQQALANIAMGTGMPLSLLMANSANYATAKEEKATWYENDIIPLCNWIAYEYNRQVFEPIGLRLEFHPETLDPQQEDETERAGAMKAYAEVLEKCSSAEMFLGLAEMMGLEVPDSFQSTLGKYFADKEQKEKEMQEQMRQGGYVLGGDGKPVPAQAQPKDEPKKKDEEKKPAPARAMSTTKANDNSAMIALRIPDVVREEIKGRYPFVDAETLDNLHITLIYLGDSRTLNKIDVIRAASEFGQYQAPIKGKLQGLARFVNGQDVDPLVVTFDSPQMPRVYTGLASALDSYHIPYHKEHGFIPHMTLAYIPADADMPIDSIEPIEINFSDVYLVDGETWMAISLTGYDNKTVWTPTLDELEEMRVWREVALRKHRKGEPLDFEYEPHHGGLPAEFAASVKARLQAAQTAEDVRQAFVIAETVTPAPEYKAATTTADPAILELAAALNRMADRMGEITNG